MLVTKYSGMRSVGVGLNLGSRERLLIGTDHLNPFYLGRLLYNITSGLQLICLVREQPIFI